MSISADGAYRACVDSVRAALLRSQIHAENSVDIVESAHKERNVSYYGATALPDGQVEFRLPAAYGQLMFGPPATDSRSIGDALPAAMQCTVALHTYQESMRARVLERLRATGATVMIMPTGFGKTETAIGIIAELRRKTLFIVRTKDMVTQTAERIRQYISQCSVSEAMEGKRDSQADIIVSTARGLTVNPLSADERASIGLVIADEVHGMVTECNSQIFRDMAGSRYTLGLSATPERPDDFRRLLRAFFGDDYPSIERRNKPIRLCCMRYNNDQYVVPKRTVYKKVNGVIQKAEELDVASLHRYWMMSEDRSRMLGCAIARLAMEGHVIFAFGHELYHLEEACYFLREELERHERYDLLEDIGIMHAGVSKHQRADTYARRIVFLTYSMARDGLNKPSVSVLVAISIEGALIQPIGRILRDYPGKFPLVVLLRDSCRGLAYKYANITRYLESDEFELHRCMVHGWNLNNDSETARKKCLFAPLKRLPPAAALAPVSAAKRFQCMAV